MTMNTWKTIGASLAVLALVACESGEDKAARFTENAQQYLEEGDLTRARIQFANALKNDPANLEALRGAALVAEREERYGQQLRFLERLNTEAPGDPEVLGKMARLNLLSGKPDVALDRANQALEADPEALEALTVKGAALVLQNNLDAASETLEKALALAPENAEVRNLLAARYVRDEDFERAQAVIDEGLLANPRDEALLVVKLLLAQRRQDANAMDETFATLIEASPENGFYREQYAEFLLAARGDLDEARTQLRAALPLLEDKTSVTGRLIGIIRSQEGDEIAEEELRKIVADYPETNLVFAIPSFLCQIGETERCQAELERLATAEDVTDEIRAQAKVQLGERAFAERDFDTALAYADEVLGADETNPDALTLKGKIEFAQERPEAAIETLRLALNNEPDKEAALILLGLAYEANGRAAFGEAQLAQAIERLGLSPTLFQAYRAMLVRNGKNDEAADLTLRFAQTPDASPQVQRESAAVLLAQGRAEEAEVVARSLIRADGEDQTARRLLATALLAQDRDEEALEALDAMSEEGRDVLSSIQLRSEILSQLGRTEELRTYLRAEARDRTHPRVFALLAQFELSQDNRDAAITAAEQGVEAFPEDENLYILLYNARVAQDDPAAATAVLLEGIEKASENAALRTLRANELLGEGARAEARDLLMSLQLDGQLNDLAANNLAALMLDLGDDPAEALAIAKRFEGTEQPFFADTLAWAHYRNGNLAEALRYSEIAMGTDVDNAEIFYHRGVIAAANGDTDAARTAFEKALEAPGKTEQVSDAAIRQALSDL